MAAGKMIRESLIAQLLSLSGGIAAGFGLAQMTGILEKIPGVIILIPGLLALKGDISGSLSSRISTALHSGAISPRLESNKTLNGNILASIILTITEAFILGVVAYYVSVQSIGVGSLPIMVMLSTLTVSLAFLIQVPTTMMLTLLLYRHGIDPDSVMGPIITTIGDIVTIICLVLVASIMVG